MSSLGPNDSILKGLQRDKIIEGSQPLAIEIDGLDEQAMLNWWKKYKSDNKEFVMVGRNCSTTAMEALGIGGAETLYFMLPTPWEVYQTGQMIKTYGRDWHTKLTLNPPGFPSDPYTKYVLTH